ncbi:MAG: aminoglycoside phosphotransferase family protein [Chloroflexota bacterium]|nr:aminoglycoside phosphotransferase family protein [Chloroflexota bacterium]
MLRPWNDRPLDDLLAERGLAGLPEGLFPNDGWSGATLTVLEREKERFVLKRTSWATDWIARATDDHSLREGWLAANRPRLFPPPVAPYFGAAADGASLAILMPDLSGELIAWERPAHEPGIDAETLGRVVDAVACLHFQPWRPGTIHDTFPWCAVRPRLLLLSRPAAERYRSEGLAVGERFLAGWDAFDRLASPAARDLIQRLVDEPKPLLDALERLPRVGLHGDLKLANVALFADGRVGLIDWQLVTLAPVAVELGWFLVSNAPLLPEPPDRVLERYLVRARWHSNRYSGGVDGPPTRTIDSVLDDWAAQVDLTWIVGLLLRGWRKGLDAESGTPTGWGGSGSDDLAWWSRRAVEAADRRL